MNDGASTSFSIELFVLSASVLLGVVHVLLQSAAMTKEKGVEYNVSARDDFAPVKTVMAGRLERASHNFQETYPLFLAMDLALLATGKTGGMGSVGAALWFFARILYLPLYAFGVPVLRTMVWGLSLAGILLMLFRLGF